MWEFQEKVKYKIRAITILLVMILLRTNLTNILRRKEAISDYEKAVKKLVVQQLQVKD